MKGLTQSMNAYLAQTSVKRLAWSAFTSGGLKAIQYKSSHRSPTLASFTAHFSHYEGATRFARRINRFGIRIELKRSPLGYSVTVPAPRPYSRLPQLAGQMIPVQGGVRGLARTLTRTGFGLVMRGGAR